MKLQEFKKQMMTNPKYRRAYYKAYPERILLRLIMWVHIKSGEWINKFMEKDL